MLGLPFNTNLKIHFIGIGGIGMSGIAEILHNLGYTVQGSDAHQNANTQRLEGYGIPIFYGHCDDNLNHVDVVVISSAIKETNPELKLARQLGIVVIKRAEMLAELMRFRLSIAVAGTHGKTTTTSMNATLLDAAHFDPTIINGGILNSFNSNARLGTSQWMVVEADESDGTFTKLPATIGIVTNIDPEHMEHYKTVEALHQAFYQFLDQLPFYGLGVVCIDHPVVRDLAQRITHKRIMTYGFHDQAEVRGYNLRQTPTGTYFDVEITPQEQKRCLNAGENLCFIPKRHKDLFLPMVGSHNVQNFLSCIAVAQELGLPFETIEETLSQFKGVKRRFDRVGTVHGMHVIDDYAHHPAEIETVIDAAKQCQPKRLIAVVQPHRYTRLQALIDDFAQSTQKADYVIVCPVYSAQEDPIPGIDHHALADKMRLLGQTVIALETLDDLAININKIAQDGDMILCMGAGNITAAAHKLVHLLLPPEENAILAS